MFRRAAGQLIFSAALVFFGLSAEAQVKFEPGEINLRGTLILKKKQPPTLVINSGNRAMKSFLLNHKELDKQLKDYVSGTKVEVCMNMTEVESKLSGELLKIRPLAPNEGILTYTGTLKGCKTSKGCKEFGKSMEASLLGDTAEMKDSPTDYFGCLP